MGAYRLKQHIWGRCPMVVELGDPLQMRPVQTVSLFDTSEMLKQRVVKGGTVSIEAQWAIKAFKDFDCVFELTETKRFVPGNPIAPFLQKVFETPIQPRGESSMKMCGINSKGVASSSPTMEVS